MYKLYQKSSQYHNVRTRVFPPINPSSTHYKAFLFFLSLLYQNYIVLGLFYNPTNPMFYLFSLILSCSRSPHNFLLLHFFQSLRNKIAHKQYHNLLLLVFAWCLGAELLSQPPSSFKERDHLIPFFLRINKLLIHFHSFTLSKFYFEIKRKV